MRKSPILSSWSYVDDDKPIPHLTTVGIEAKFPVAKDVVSNEILRLKGLLFDHIAVIIPSHVRNGKDFSVSAEPSLSGTLKNNPYGTEARLVTAVEKSLSYSRYVGCAYNRAEPGDNIYLLAGCSVPVVLRRRADGGYTIVGYVHVEGVMSGQIMKLELDGERRRGSPGGNWIDLEIY